MLNYETIYVTTSLIYIFSVNKLLEAFFCSDKQNKLARNIILPIFFLIISIMIFITRVPIVGFITNAILIFTLTLSYDTTFQKRLIYSSLTLSLGFVIELIFAVIYGYTDLSALQNSTFSSISGLIITRTILMIVAYLVNRYRISTKKHLAIPKLYYLAFSIVLTGTSYLFIASLGSNHITIDNIFLSGFILLAVNITMIVVDEKIYNSLIVSNEKKIVEQQNIAYENQLDLINQSIESMRLLKHDLKNHLIMLNEMYESNKTDDAKKYMNKIIFNMDNGVLCNSENFVIDSIINFKLHSIKKDVNISLSINVPHTINILAHDLTIILGNLLDNAITAALTSSEKILEISISTKFDNLIILIDNSFDGKIIEENGELKTTKPFRSSHGLGLKSVKNTLEQYGGELRIEYTTDMFSISVIIPY